jgi:centromeric protein E
LDGKFSTEKMLSTMSDIGAQLFATLEGHLTMFTNGERSSTGNYALIQEPQKEFHEKVKNIITSLELSESSITKNQDGTPLCSCEQKVVVWPQISRYQSSIMVLFCVIFLGYLVSFFKTLLPLIPHSN